MQGGAKAPPSSFSRLRQPGLANLLISGGHRDERLRIAREYHETSRLRLGPFVATLGGQGDWASVLLHALTYTPAAGRDTPLHRAEGGTLFLDEIDRLNLEAQRLFFEFLRRGRSEGPRDSGWAGRIAAGATRDLGSLVARGLFLAPLHDALDKIRIDLGDAPAAESAR